VVALTRATLLFGVISLRSMFMFATLSQVILDTEHPAKAQSVTDPEVMTSVAKLLCRKQRRINPMVALSLLPGESMCQTVCIRACACVCLCV
jgi:hypothetical protein